MCPETYVSEDTYLTYYCDLEEGHAGPHEDHAGGPDTVWYF